MYVSKPQSRSFRTTYSLHETTQVPALLHPIMSATERLRLLDMVKVSHSRYLNWRMVTTKKLSMDAALRIDLFWGYQEPRLRYIDLSYLLLQYIIRLKLTHNKVCQAFTSQEDNLDKEYNNRR